ncbi:MAG: hypothetical protein R3242_09220 [Akkermansiaceae bacterium]|nr:hypothetical protein [Akkermansiaceae bacterium]
MKKLITALGALTLTLLTSCLQNETTLSLNKDGSGTITEITTFGPEIFQMMGAVGEGGDPMEQMLQQNKERSEKAVASMGEGVTLKEVKAINRDGKKGVITVYEFKDVNKLNYVFGQSMNEGGPEGEEGEPLKLSYKDGVLTLDNTLEEGDAGDADVAGEAPGPEEMAMAKQMMKDVRMSFKLEFPGGIAETNGEYVDGNKVTLMDLDMGALVNNDEKFKEFMTSDPGSAAEAKKILDGIEGIKVEGADTLSVKLK